MQTVCNNVSLLSLEGLLSISVGGPVTLSSIAAELGSFRRITVNEKIVFAILVCLLYLCVSRGTYMSQLFCISPHTWAGQSLMSAGTFHLHVFLCKVGRCGLFP